MYAYANNNNNNNNNLFLLRWEALISSSLLIQPVPTITLLESLLLTSLML